MGTHYTGRVKRLKRVRLAGLDPGPAELRPWAPSIEALAPTLAGLIALVVLVVLGLFLERGALGRYEYALWRWEAGNLTTSVFVLLGAGEELDASAEAERLATYFALTSAIRAELQAAEPDEALVAQLVSERALYENDVERIIEGYVTDAVAAAGLSRPLPLFGGVEVLWPPVDLELTNPPQLLVRSPRDEIRREGDTLLKSGLTLEEVEAIEARVDDGETVSVVVAIGGLAAYPAIVREDRAYDTVVRLTAHEWVHHYLAFYPLGLAWGSREGTTLNETVADLVERELWRIVQELHPVSLPAGADGRAPPRAQATVSFSEEMRALRLAVDALLAEGRVAEAEGLMEERQLYLAENGILIRKINQAYFAFYGSYASLPQSSDPIGPKVERVWEETGDLATFLALVREVQSVAELDEVLRGLGVDPSTITVEGAGG